MTALVVPFGDLKRQHELLRAELEAAFARVLSSGWYILGQEVAAFESAFAAACGVAHCVGVSSGADALYLALAAHDIGPGDEVITVANACMYELSAILQTGARPVLVDVRLRGRDHAAHQGRAASPSVRAPRRHARDLRDRRAP